MRERLAALWRVWTDSGVLVQADKQLSKQRGRLHEINLENGLYRAQTVDAQRRAKVYEDVLIQQGLLRPGTYFSDPLRLTGDADTALARATRTLRFAEDELRRLKDELRRLKAPYRPLADYTGEEHL